LTWDRIEETRSFQQALDTAASAADRGDHIAAIQALDRALALRPSDLDATRARSKALAARDAAAARSARQAASEKLASLRRILAESPADAASVDALRRERNTRYLTPEEHVRIFKADGLAQEMARSFEQVFFAALEFVNTAESLEPGSPETAALRADLWLERWRDAKRRGDEDSAAFFGRLVESSDVSSRHAAELHPSGALQLETDPPGAEVYLFRYREQADVVPGGEHRLVPVPVFDAPTPVPPGTWCLRVVSPVPGIEPTDVIVKLAGRPSRTSSSSRAARARFRPLTGSFRSTASPCAKPTTLPRPMPVNPKPARCTTTSSSATASPSLSRPLECVLSGSALGNPIRSRGRCRAPWRCGATGKP
jgi:hypothetical protein